MRFIYGRDIIASQKYLTIILIVASTEILPGITCCYIIINLASVSTSGLLKKSKAYNILLI